MGLLRKAAKRQQNKAQGVSPGFDFSPTQAAKRRQMLRICRPCGAVT
jgi:hypothetical protein